MKFNALILAGGKSSRMGHDKAFLEVDGVALLGRQSFRLVLAGYFSVSYEFGRFFRNLNSPEDLSGIFEPSLPRGIIDHG